MSHAPSSALNERIDRLERQLVSLRKHLARRTRFTAIVALLLLIVLAGYFYFGYKNFDEVTRPEMVVQVAETFVDSNLPELRKSLHAEIVRSAPGWAAQLSKEVQSGMPQARAQLENYIEGQMDAMLDEASAFSQDQFRTFLKENRPVLERGFQDLAESPTLAEETMKGVVDGLDKQLSKRMQLESAELFEILSMMRNKLALLENAQNLSKEQQLERHLAMLTRRLKLETFDSASTAGQNDQVKAALVPVAASVPAGEETAADASHPASDAKEDGAGKEKAAAPAEAGEQTDGDQKGEPAQKDERPESAEEKEPGNQPE